MNIEGKQLIIICLLAIVTNSTIYLKKYQMEKKKGKGGKENNLGLINDDQDNFCSYSVLARIQFQYIIENKI